MEKFKRYLDAYDGSAGWDEIRPLFDDLFHDDLVVVTADREMNKEQWAEMAQGLVARHATSSDFEITAESDDTIEYRLTLEVGDDDPIHMQAKATIVDGQIARVEPANPDAYSEMIDRAD